MTVSASSVFDERKGRKMEEILTDALRSRLERLKETIKSTIELLDKVELGVGVQQQYLMANNIELNYKVKQFQGELDKYLTQVTNPDKNLYKECHNQLIDAEEKLTRIEIIIKLYCAEAHDNQLSTRLPKLDLTKFNGDILKWKSFWDRFVANVDHKKIADVEKFSYLISSLEGPALQALEGLETTNQNYQIATTILKDRFGKTNSVIDAHNKALQNLERAQSTPECRKILNIIDTHLRVLSSLGENTEASHLRVIILDKFPENILYQVKLITAEEETTDNIKKALDKVITAMEQVNIQTPQTLQMTTSTIMPGSTSTLLKITRERPAKRKRLSDKTNTFRPKKPKISCIFCGKEGHYNEDCNEFRTYKERMSRLQRRCLKCFRNGHRASKCFSRKKCLHCGKLHNRALCPQKTKKDCSDPSSESKQQTSNV